MRKFILGAILGITATTGILALPTFSQIQTVTSSPITTPITPVLPGDPNIFVDLAKRVVPSVVNIATSSAPKYRGSPRSNNPEDLFRKDFEKFFGFRDSEQPTVQALGTGVIITSSKGEALILTNHHVIAEADQVEIQFTEGSQEKAAKGEIVGRDPDLDLALIKVKTKNNLAPLPFGDSDALKVGEYVMAVGNPFGQGHSVSHGIISAKDRLAPTILGRYLQTDAPINPGNSGGPLVNLRGEIIGINNAILAQAQGIGFAIPSNEILPVLTQLKEKGKVSRGYIGIRMGELSPEMASFTGKTFEAGTPYVADIEPQSPAAKAGLKPNDIILEFNEKKVSSPRELLFQVTSTPIGDTANLKISREGKIKNLRVQITKRPI